MKLTIIGAGPGGYVAAIKAAQLGAEVTVVEESAVGGTCLNSGCIPTKTIIASTDALRKTKTLSDFGIELASEAIPNLSKIIERKNKVVSNMAKGILALFKNRSIKLVEGKGSIISPTVVRVEKKDGSTEEVHTDKIIVATGSRPAEIPLFPFNGKTILSSTDVLSLSEIPKSLIIIGAGVIGCEFACIFSELGADVTMLEMLPRAVSTEDSEISEALEKELKKKKIKLMTSAKIIDCITFNDSVKITLDNGKEISGERMLVSIGRALNTENLGLENAGIDKGFKGEIKVNHQMETNVPGIYAVGDVVGGMLLAHVASKEGVVAASNACGIPVDMDYSVVPAAIFTSPEIGSVGLREHQALERGISINTGRFQFRGLGKAHAIGEISGFVKIIADAETDEVLGVHIIGPNASDLVHEGALAIKSGLTASELGDMIHAHPTLSEALMEAAEDVHGEAIHALKK
ncbi:MAG: dihydrolipoyl dehydrogenase [Nitrospirae bacterium]|nr:dihydrolipoyl dehydrogenase [Nitrospirota bacterium]